MKKWMLLTVISVLALTLSACTNVSGTGKLPESNELLSESEAESIAFEQVDVNNDYDAVVEKEYNDDVGRWEYEVSIYTADEKIEIILDATDGSVLKVEKGSLEPTVEHSTVKADSTITTVPTTSKTSKLQPTDSKTTTSKTTTSTKSKLISKDVAKDKALNHVGVVESDVSRVKIELDYDDDFHRWEYEIEFYVGATEYDVVVDAVLGTVVDMDIDAPKTTTAAVTTTSDKLTKAQAKSIALKTANVSVEDISRYEIELDYDDDDNRWEYEIGFYANGMEYDIVIDAVSGNVLEFEKDAD